MTSRVSGSTFIVDHSAWVRVSNSASVRNALRAIVENHGPDAITVCPPVALEVGFSARSGADHTRVMTELAAFPECVRTPTPHAALKIQNALWVAGRVRAAGTIDTLIAAYALANDATVLHFDSDFDHIATVIPAFRHQWIVPRGSI